MDDALETLEHHAQNVRNAAFSLFDERLNASTSISDSRKAFRALILMLKAIDVATEAARDVEPAPSSAQFVHVAIRAAAARGLPPDVLKQDLDAVAQVVAEHLV